MKINLDFYNSYYFWLKKYKKVFLEISKEIFDYLKLKNSQIIFDCSFVSYKKIKELNNQLRKIDKVTDVISIAYWDNQIVKTDLLGEIFICVKKAKQQAKEYKHSFFRELNFLFIHGLLHLLGYDHLNEEQEKEMFSIQEIILSKLNIKR